MSEVDIKRYKFDANGQAIDPGKAPKLFLNKKSTYKKYRNKWTKCKAGHNHQSKREAEYCEELALLKRSGEILDYSIQVPYKLYCNNNYICTHIVDFVIMRLEFGFLIKEVHEVKSKPTMNPYWKLKKKLFEINYPDIKYFIIK